MDTEDWTEIPKITIDSIHDPTKNQTIPLLGFVKSKLLYKT